MRRHYAHDSTNLMKNKVKVEYKVIQLETKRSIGSVDLPVEMTNVVNRLS